MNATLLKEKICASGISIAFIARKIGISREGLYKKLNNETEFKASEISCIKQILHLSNQERDAIFFDNEMQ